MRTSTKLNHAGETSIMRSKKQQTIMGKITHTFKQFFNPGPTKPASGARRKRKDTTVFSIEDYSAIKTARVAEFNDLTWEEFGNAMNARYRVNKTKTTWTNIVRRNTAYLQKLDY